MDRTSRSYSAAQASAAQALRTGGRDTVRAALLEVRSRTLAQAQAWAAVGADVAYDPWLNPPRWEWGHIAWFQDYWIARNRQRELGSACDPDHPRAPSPLPEADAWYDSGRVAHETRWGLPLPDLEGTFAYLAQVQARTLAELDALPADAGHDALYFFRLVALHEAMHAEAGAYMALRLGAPLPPHEPSPLPSGARIAVPAQRFRLGSGGPGFAFDNELAGREVGLDAFEIDAQPVSWKQFQDFVEADGYAQRQWWSEEGWSWRQHSRPAAPVGPRRLAAVHLSAFEAEAWCSWAGRRLPSEAEWECAALTADGFHWGAVWEWTASAFQPYPGFTAHPYRDYSQPWFGSRRVLRGAARATSPWLAHPRYRNFFEPQRTDVFAGFRSCGTPAATPAV